MYQQLSRFRLLNDQDAESFAYEALYNAILTFDEAKDNTFCTYAICVISNALRGHLRRKYKKRQLETVSYYEAISADEESVYLLDTLKQIEDTESTVLSNELNEVIRTAYNETLKGLSDKHRQIVVMHYDEEPRKTQQEISKILGISQATVSNVLAGFKYKIKVKLEEYM